MDPAAYERFMGRWSRMLARRVVAAHPPAPGARVLDLGAGNGVLAEVLRDTGAGVVVPSDVSPGQLRDLGRAGAVAADAQALPFDDGAFDAAYTGLTLNFVPDPVLASRELRRVVRPGGDLVAYVWAYGRGMTMLDTFWDAAVDLGLDGASEAHEGQRFPLAGSGALGKALAAGGGDVVHEGEIHLEQLFSHFDDYWLPFFDGVGPSGSFAAGLHAKDAERLREAVFERLGHPKGAIEMRSRAWLVVARVA